MGQVKRLWEQEREALWQMYFDDYVLDHFGGRDVSGQEFDEAADYAEEMVRENFDANGTQE